MPGMPYVVEKGELFPVIEDYVSSLNRRLTLLENLRNPDVAVWRTGVLWPAARECVWRDWLGSPTRTATGEWMQPVPQAPSTGHWVRWFGPAEAILRETLVRAIEVSLGMDNGGMPSGATIGGPVSAAAHDQAAVANGAVGPSAMHANAAGGPFDRCWPIEILWVCGAPNFQGWVTWRTHGSAPTEGQVTVILSTPPPMMPPGDEMYGGVVDPNGNATDEYKEGPGVPDVSNRPTDTLAPRGIWVIGARESNVVWIDTTVTATIDPNFITFASPGGPLDFALPTPAVLAQLNGFKFQFTLPLSFRQEQDGPAGIAVVRPAVDDGGVALRPPTFPHPTQDM